VADEISKLADQTAASIKEIDILIKQNNTEISNGFANIQSTTSLITGIVDGVGVIGEKMGSLSSTVQEQSSAKEKVEQEAASVKIRSDEIKAATDEQRRAMDEIMKSISSINDLTQANAAGSEEMTRSAELVEQMAETLKEQTDYFSTR
jgi:methyl-accepting chemotaxis protein